MVSPTNLIKIVNQMPESIKLGFDAGAATTSILAFSQVITGVFGAIGAILSAAWAAYRLYNEHKKNKK